MDKLESLPSPTLECPNPFMRLKSRLPADTYQSMCHIVLELETEMLKGRKLPVSHNGSSLQAAFMKQLAGDPFEGLRASN